MYDIIIFILNFYINSLILHTNPKKIKTMNILYAKKIVAKITTLGLLVALTQADCWGASGNFEKSHKQVRFATILMEQEVTLTPIDFTQLPSGADLVTAVQNNDFDHVQELIRQFNHAIQSIAVQIICIRAKDSNTPQLGNEIIPEPLDKKMRQLIKENKITWEELYQNIKMWQTVKKHGAVDAAIIILNPEFFSYQNDQPFRAAVTNGHTGIVQQLLRAGVNPTIIGRNGLTALMVATRNGDIAMVQELLNYAEFHKIDIVNATNKNNNTALRFAITGGHEAIEDMLRQAIADQKSH